MTEQGWIELGKRAVACEGWRWMRGMLDLGDWEVRGEYNCGHGVRVVDRAGKTAIVPPTRMSAPDLRDPATVGCLLALVREAWAPLLVWTSPYYRDRDSGARWEATTSESVVVGWNEAEALVTALEVAPSKGAE